MATPTPTSFAGLLQSAVTDPGTLSRAYRQFHQYSLGNQLLAWAQCLEREIPVLDHVIIGDTGRYCSFKETGRIG